MDGTSGPGAIDRLGALREKCVVVLTAYGASQALAAALGGVYFAFKSVKFVAPLHDALMAEAGGRDAAGYFAETMVRSLHSSGDLLARALVECGYAKGDHITGLTYAGAGTDTLKQKVDGLLGLPAWKYVAAFTNTTKHNAFIDRTSVSTATSHEILFKGFDRDLHSAEDLGLHPVETLRSRGHAGLDTGGPHRPGAGNGVRESRRAPEGRERPQR